MEGEGVSCWRKKGCGCVGPVGWSRVTGLQKDDVAPEI